MHARGSLKAKATHAALKICSSDMFSGTFGKIEFHTREIGMGNGSCRGNMFCILYLITHPNVITKSHHSSQHTCGGAGGSGMEGCVRYSTHE